MFSSKKCRIIHPIIMAVILILTACANSGTTTAPAGNASANQLPLAEMIFQVTIPTALPENTSLAVDILDEVTGLAFNPTRYQMSAIDPISYYVRVNVPLGAVLKYRYVRISEIATPEYTSLNQPVRYRLYYITGPAIIQDKVAGWIDAPFGGNGGTIKGQVLSGDSNGIPGIYVTIDGMMTYTLGDGSFSISNVPAGSHTLVAYSIDGAYSVFQQGAVIAENATTPAVFQVTPAKYVKVTFDVVVPEGDYTNIPIKVIGSLYQLGNTFQT